LLGFSSVGLSPLLPGYKSKATNGDQHGEKGAERTRHFLKLKETVQAADPAHDAQDQEQPAEQPVQAISPGPFQWCSGPRQQAESVSLSPVDGAARIGYGLDL